MDLTTVDHLLTTTRSVRKRLDLTRPVEPDIIQQCLEIAIQAPQGGNVTWYHFVVVTDPTKRAELAKLYNRGAVEIYPPQRLEEIRQTRPDDVASWLYLAEHLHEVPVHIIPCVTNREWFSRLAPDAGPASMYGCILPVAWSLMLALRSRGLGSAWTTAHLQHAEDAAALLGIPENVAQAALLPVAYFTGADFKPAKRVPARERTSWNTWGQKH
jgi:nitroreductase